MLPSPQLSEPLPSWGLVKELCLSYWSNMLCERKGCPMDPTHGILRGAGSCLASCLDHMSHHGGQLEQQEWHGLCGVWPHRGQRCGDKESGSWFWVGTVPGEPAPIGSIDLCWEQLPAAQVGGGGLPSRHVWHRIREQQWTDWTSDMVPSTVYEGLLQFTYN